MAGVPAGVRGQRYGQIREPNARDFIPVRIHSRDKRLVRFAQVRWQPGGDALVPRWSKVKSMWLRNNTREGSAWEGLEHGGKAVGRHCCPVSQTGIAAR